MLDRMRFTHLIKRSYESERRHPETNYRLAIKFSLWLDVDWVYNLERFDEKDVGGLE
jgi:hypothetical protein